MRGRVPSAAGEDAPAGRILHTPARRQPNTPAGVPPRDAGAAELRVGGLTPLTSVDYPGQLAAVVFCQGCPWRCSYCHNRHLLGPRAAEPLPWSGVRRFLARRRGLLDAVVFSGGEPSLQAALPGAMDDVRRLGFRVGLHTGGPSPARLARLLPLVDWVGLDAKALPGRYGEVTGVAGSGARAWESLRRVLDSGVDYEVRTTLPPGWGLADDLIPLMDRLAEAGVRRYALQLPRRGPVLDASRERGLMPPDRGALRRAGIARFPEFELR